MTTKEDASEKVSAPAKACDEVHANVKEACRQLDGDFSMACSGEWAFRLPLFRWRFHGHVILKN